MDGWINNSVYGPANSVYFSYSEPMEQGDNEKLFATETKGSAFIGIKARTASLAG